ncbi:MAG TPA: ATP synthase F1 subunit delta [Actinomycetes bacterium]|nr:ATP synthase F1 subunit delta [Actinomycetes bacterium]
MSARLDGYASAIFEVAKAEDALEEVEDELFRFARVLEASDDLRSTLTDANLPAERRQAIVEDLLGGKALPLTTSLVSFVVGAGRARDLPAIIDRLVERAAAERRHAGAEVRSAVELDADQRKRLAEALSSNLGKDVEVKVIVDPSVMGGLSARVDDTVIDGTVRHRLDQLRESL